MGKIVETRKLYKETLNSITQTEQNWITFLDSISWHFKYDFADQILIYAQRPDAKACAKIEVWNNDLNRWVNKDAQFIFVLSKDENSPYPFRLVFDVSDTHNYKGNEYKLWSVKPEYEEKVIETLETTFGGESETNSLEECIIDNAYNMVSDNIQDYLTTIHEYKKGTVLENLSDEEIKNIALLTVWASVSYMMMTRCGINAREKIGIEQFSFIKNFNNDKIISALGTAISDIAEMGLREIAKTVTNLENEEKRLNHTFVKNNKQEYSNNKEIVKGGIENDEDRIQKGGRLQSTEFSNGERKNTKWQIRKNEIELSKEIQESRLFDIIDGQKLEQRIIENTRTSNGNGERDNREISQTRGNNRKIESTRPNEMDRTNEQLQNDSTRTNNERANIHIEEYNNNFWKQEKDSNIDVFDDDETIENILKNAPNIVKVEESLKEFLRLNSQENIEQRIKKTLGEAYTEYYINNDIRVGYKSYENGLHMWKGESYLHRKEECFREWKEIAQYFMSDILLQENENMVNEIPTENEQKQNIVEVENTSTFSFSQEEIDNVLREGSHTENGKFRIYEFLSRGLSSQENINFLKHEYGDGGRSYDAEDISESHSAKGIRLYIGYKEDRPELLLTWKQVEKRIRELIGADRYFNQQEQDEYYDWLDVNGIENKNNTRELIHNEDYNVGKKLNDFLQEYDIVSYNQNFPIENTNEDNIELIIADINDDSNIRAYIEFLKSTYEDLDYDDEMAVEARGLVVELERRLPYYEFHIGDIVYIGTEEYEIRAIDNERVVVVDTSFPLFSKEIAREEFNKKVKENPANDKLRTGKRIQDMVSKENIIDETEEKQEKEEIVQTENTIETIGNKEEKQDTTPLKANIKTKRRNKIEYFDLHPDVPMEDRNNYKIKNNDLGIGTKKEKYRNNIEAIKILKLCEEQNRYATKEEQEILSKYVGWGGLPEAFDSRNDSWNTEYKELSSLLTEKEYSEAKRSTLTAFYTPPIVIKSIYKALENMGLEKGNILEPSCRCR